MEKMWSRGLIALLLVAVLGGCATRTVRQVTADPYRYRDREVTVSGRVVESFALANRGAYEIEDRTGRLWIISDRGVPGRDTRVTVKGTVRTAFNFGPIGDVAKLPASLRSGFVLVESSRNVRD
jgi:hypothetical protein